MIWRSQKLRQLQNVRATESILSRIIREKIPNRLIGLPGAE
jgi:hypothetical protein